MIIDSLKAKLFNKIFKFSIPLKHIFIIIFIFTCVFAVIRLFDLDNYAMHRDELANGLDAYTLGINGTNIWGEKFPVFFKLHNTDLLEPTYKYLLVPFVYLFGRTEFSVRILGVLISIFSIFFIFKVAKEIFNNTKLAYLSAFFLSISFVNFIFSRIGFRANLIPLYLIFIIFFFYKTKKNEHYFPLLMLSLGLTLWTYAVSRVMIPVLCLLPLYLILNKNIKINLIQILTGAIIFITLAFPIYYLSFFDKTFAARTAKVAVFDESNALELVQKNIASYYSWDYNFSKGDTNKRYNVAGFGFENPVIIILSLLGVVVALKKKKEFGFVVLIVYVSCMLPGFLTEPYHSLRTLGVVIPLVLLASYGAMFVLTKHFAMFKLLILLAITINIVFNIDYFFYNKKGHNAFYPGIKEAVIYANNIAKPVNVIYGFGIYRPYVFQLFYGQSYGGAAKSYVDEFTSRQCNVGTNIVDCYYHPEFTKQGNIYIEQENRLSGLENFAEIVFMSKDNFGEKQYAVIK